MRGTHLVDVGLFHDLVQGGEHHIEERHELVGQQRGHQLGEVADLDWGREKMGGAMCVRVACIQRLTCGWKHSPPTVPRTEQDACLWEGGRKARVGVARLLDFLDDVLGQHQRQDLVRVAQLALRPEDVLPPLEVGDLLDDWEIRICEVRKQLL